jgi:hypothetical protein
MQITKFNQLLIVILVFLSSGCSPVVSWLYGIKDPERISTNEIQIYTRRYKIPAIDNYELDTGYWSYLFSLDTLIYKNEIKNHYQPLQVLYFDSTGEMISFHVNCYAQGFPNLKWNCNGVLDVFPPGRQATVDTLLNLRKQIGFLRLLPASANISTQIYRYTVFIYWNRFMGRQTKRLVRYVQANAALAKTDPVKIIYVNTDNIFAER